jgi:hypothetical protein
VEFTQLSARVWKEQMEFIDKAARKLRISAAEFVRRTVLPEAAKVLGVKMPDWPPFVHGRGGALAQLAGKATRNVREAWLDRLEALALKDPEAVKAILRDIDEEEAPQTPRTRSDSRQLSPQGGMPVAKKRQTR